ncbi:hypothetical protein E2C01_062422 [Portunus trituberculatus]|uniref:Uncharacterized protein n=1 Tax=Portunus trituberculatus TaxID=210409 RepID=A0A5B7HHZ5_PORTR|nr:hypothetical protein [Portunus trituberculatus]
MTLRSRLNFLPGYPSRGLVRCEGVRARRVSTLVQLIAIEGQTGASLTKLSTLIQISPADSIMAYYLVGGHET